MTSLRWTRWFLVAAALGLAGCTATFSRPPASEAPPALVGAWRSNVQFTSGAFAAVHDLEFLYVFNAGGTMTESSNYDGAPPVPPAYGIWRGVGEREFEARYDFFMTKPPAGLGDLTGGGGWMPSGRGVLTERITLAADGKSFTSTVRYEGFGADGKPVPGGGAGKGRGTRLEF